MDIFINKSNKIHPFLRLKIIHLAIFIFYCDTFINRIKYEIYFQLLHLLTNVLKSRVCLLTSFLEIFDFLALNLCCCFQLLDFLTLIFYVLLQLKNLNKNKSIILHFISLDLPVYLLTSPFLLSSIYCSFLRNTFLHLIFVFLRYFLALVSVDLE